MKKIKWSLRPYSVKQNAEIYEATLPDGFVVPLLVDQFIVVENGEFATFYIGHSAVNYNVDTINAVKFGDQFSRFATISRV